MKSENDSKYVKLKEYIKGLILNAELKPGDRIYSENELALRFNISRHTVRQSISLLANEGWLYSRQGKGTFVARIPDIKKQKSGIIGVITTYLNDYIFPEVIKGIDEVLSNEGFSIILGHTANKTQNERDNLLKLFDKNIDGLIAEPSKSALPNPNLDLYREISSRGIPVVFIHSCYKDLNYSYVIEDDEKGGCLAAKHLLSLGHRKISGVFKADDNQGQNRYKGYVKALKEEGIKNDDSQVMWYSTEEKESMFEKKDSTDNIIELLKKSTAVVCYNDQISVKLLDLLKKNSLRVPEHISLVSFDDSDISKLTEVKLTSVAHPMGKLGRKAAESILELLRGSKIHIEEVMEPELIVRQSTKTI